MDTKEKRPILCNKEPSITYVQCELNEEHILNTFKVTMTEYNRYKPKDIEHTSVSILRRGSHQIDNISLFTVYTSVATNLNETKYIKVWRSKHTYESQYPNKQCQQLVLGTSCTPKTGYWACIDKSNGDQENTWYVWLFRSLKEANLHIRNQKLKPDYAELSLPVPVISIKSV